MKKYLPILLLVSTGAFAQGVPTLSTADKVAITALEKTKNDARKQFEDAQQQELQIEREWQAAHPGYSINPDTFAVVALPKPASKPEVKK